MNKLPPKDILESDLENIINIYTNQMEDVQPKTKTVTAERKENFSVVKLRSYISQSGLVFSGTLISRFVASLLTKPFVLLTGLSGSGKQKLHRVLPDGLVTIKVNTKLSLSAQTGRTGSRYWVIPTD